MGGVSLSFLSLVQEKAKSTSTKSTIIDTQIYTKIGTAVV